MLPATGLASQNASSLDCPALAGTRPEQVIDLILERASGGLYLVRAMFIRYAHRPGTTATTGW
jgi:hypothetical protein